MDAAESPNPDQTSAPEPATITPTTNLVTPAGQAEPPKPTLPPTPAAPNKVITDALPTISNVQPSSPIASTPFVGDHSGDAGVLDKKPRKKFNPLILIIIVALIAIGVGGIFFFAKPAASNPKSASSTVTTCPAITVTNANFNTSPYKGCFDQHFATCTSAEITITNQSSFATGIVNKYQIISKQGSSCLVQWQYVKLPANPSWDGKTVTCAYDNSKDFYTALSAKTDFTGCTGPLLTAMVPKTTSTPGVTQTNTTFNVTTTN